MLYHRVERLVARTFNVLRQFGRALTGGSWQRALVHGAIIAIVFTGGALLYAWSGLVTLAATSGHWPVTYWFLDFAKRNGVETQSIGIDVPSLDDPALVLKGAGHYATGCEACHGAPGRTRSLVSRQMAPEPPFLPPKIARWDAEELFWIVKHGIKFTGMPAWPVQNRDDEVWAMVSFLQKLPTMDAKEYARLAYSEDRYGVEEKAVEQPPRDLRSLAEPAGSALADCARCHGRDGKGRGHGAFPRLANQSETYLLESLRAYADGERHSGVMQPVAANLEEDVLRALAGYFAGLPGADPRPVSPEGRADLERGSVISLQGIPERGVPACSQCHGPGPPRNEIYPSLAGQYANYLELQLKLFKHGARGGTPYAHIMNTVTRRMTEEDMRAVALYYASLPSLETGE